MAKVLPVTTSFLAVSSMFRLDAFARSLPKEAGEELFVLLTALRSAGRRLKLANWRGAGGLYTGLKHAYMQGFVEETVPLHSQSDFKICFRISKGTFKVADKQRNI